MQLRATQGSPRNGGKLTQQTNKCNNQIKNVLEVARKCEDVNACNALLPWVQSTVWAEMHSAMCDLHLGKSNQPQGRMTPIFCLWWLLDFLPTSPSVPDSKLQIWGRTETLLEGIQTSVSFGWNGPWAAGSLRIYKYPITLSLMGCLGSNIKELTGCWAGLAKFILVAAIRQPQSSPVRLHINVVDNLAKHQHHHQPPSSWAP